MIATMFICGDYRSRPSACVCYPWRDAQLLFSECQFVRDGMVLELAELEASKTSDEITMFCKSCGRCCYVWGVSSEGKKPVSACSRLIVVSKANESLHVDQLAMIRTTEISEFY